MKKGYVMILTILIMSLGIISIMFLYNIIDDRVVINKNDLNIIQADYIAESAINFFIDEDFTEDLKNLYKLRTQQEKGINKTLDVLGEKVDLNLKIIKSKSILFEIESKCKYKTIDANWYAYGSVINELYTKEISVINQRTCEIKGKLCDENQLNELKNVLDYGQTTLIELPAEQVYVRKVDTKLTFFTITDNQENVIANTDNTNIYISQNGGSLTALNDITIQGIVDVDQIVLEGNMYIQGILNLKSDIVALGNYNIKVDGLTLNIDQVSENNLLAKYNYTYIQAII